MSLEEFVRKEIHSALHQYARQAEIVGNRNVFLKEDAGKSTLTLYKNDLIIKFAINNPKIIASVEISCGNLETKAKLGSFLKSYVAPRDENIISYPESPLKNFSQYLDIYNTVIPKINVLEKNEHFTIEAIYTENSLKESKYKIQSIEDKKREEKNKNELEKLESQIKSYDAGTAFFNRVLRPIFIFFSQDKTHQEYVEKLLGKAPKFYE